MLNWGASLHGHEYSNRPPQTAAAAGQRRNTLLRSALVHTSNQAAAAPENSNSNSNGATARPRPPIRRRTRPVSESHLFENAVVRFEEPPKPDHEVLPPSPAPVTKPAPAPAPKAAPVASTMSEDEASATDVSDSDVSRTASSARRRRRRIPRQSTHYLLAQPAPKLRKKQRILHVRPQLMLQIQHLCANQRPRPVIDVFPSSALAKTLVAPFLRRFPRIHQIKSELSIQDIMLVRSEDYSTDDTEHRNDPEDSQIKSRDLVAILSPLRTEEDKAEIVLADGSVWLASPRSSTGPHCSYEFVSVDPSGKTTVARWVRKQVISRPLSTLSTDPSSPTSPSISPILDYKYTFSIVDPNCRRHPIMATLTNSSLEILDSYTTVSQSSSRYPPTSIPSPATPIKDVPGEPKERTTRPVEEWQKTFISVSAVWVAMRDGRAFNRPASFISPPVSPSVSPAFAKGNSHTRSTSLGDNLADLVHQAASAASDAKNRRRGPPPPSMRICEEPGQGPVPRRATSTGAAFMQKRRTLFGSSSDQLEKGQGETKERSFRRTVSGGWTGGMANGIGNEPATPTAVSRRTSVEVPNLTPLAMPDKNDMRAISPYCMSPEALESSGNNPDGFPFGELLDGPTIGLDDGPVGEVERRGRHQRWRSVTDWFRKMGPSR